MSVISPIHVTSPDPQSAVLKLLAERPELRAQKHALIFDHGQRRFTLFNQAYDEQTKRSIVQETHVFTFPENARIAECFERFTSEAIACLNRAEASNGTNLVMTGGMSSYNPMSWINFNTRWFAPYLCWSGFVDEIQIDKEKVTNEKARGDDCKKELAHYLNVEQRIPVWALQIIEVKTNDKHVRIRYRLNRSLMLRLYQPYLGFVRPPMMVPNPMLRDMIRRWCCGSD